MRRTILMSALAMAIAGSAKAQLYNNGVQLHIGPGATLFVAGSLVNNAAGNLDNDGTLTVMGDLQNDQEMSVYKGNLVLRHHAAQVISGAFPLLTMDVDMENAAGVTLATPLQVAGTIHFTNGILHVPNSDAPLILRTGATTSGASDASHVNGYLIQEGTGFHQLPIGDGSRLQPAGLDLTSNPDGMRVRYVSGNAGSGTYVGPDALLYHNAFEYWELMPISSATGNVSMLWDDYRNVSIADVADLRVARFAGGGWMNEGAASLTGTIASGSVSTVSMSSWGSFTLGSVGAGSTLPVQWRSVTGYADEQQRAVIEWIVSEQNVAAYVVERSDDGRRFLAVGQLPSKGDGEHAYRFMDAQAIAAVSYFRVRQLDRDGRETISSLVKLMANASTQLQAFPIPFRDQVTIYSATRRDAWLFSINGRLLSQHLLQAGNSRILTNHLKPGIYILKTTDGAIRRLIKD